MKFIEVRVISSQYPVKIWDETEEKRVLLKIDSISSINIDNKVICMENGISIFWVHPDDINTLIDIVSK